MRLSPIALARVPRFAGAFRARRSPAGGPRARCHRRQRQPPPRGRLEQGVLTLTLEVREGLLRPEEDGGPGVPTLAFAEVGKPPQVPGPLIRVPQVTEVRVKLRNPFSDSTLTVYGLTSHPASGDTGVGSAAGATREVRFRAGTRRDLLLLGATTGGLHRPAVVRQPAHRRARRRSARRRDRRPDLRARRLGPPDDSSTRGAASRPRT